MRGHFVECNKNTHCNYLNSFECVRRTNVLNTHRSICTNRVKTMFALCVYLYEGTRNCLRAHKSF